MRAISELPELNKGLDFGCAIGSTLVLRRLLGVEMVGVDLDYFHDRNSPSCYLSVQEHMKSLDYAVEVFDTREYPWAVCQDNEFDFIISSWSFCKDFTRTKKEENFVCPRLEELIRVLRPGGCWFVSPVGHHDVITNLAGFVNSKKKFQLISHDHKSSEELVSLVEKNQ